jgi:predicted acetyltransferase
LAEFFVVRRFRRRGIGTRIATAVLKQFLGPWEVRVLPCNESGLRFWENTIKVFVGQTVPSVRIAKDDEEWELFSFASSPVKK